MATALMNDVVAAEEDMVEMILTATVGLVMIVEVTVAMLAAIVMMATLAESIVMLEVAMTDTEVVEMIDVEVVAAATMIVMSVVENAKVDDHPEMSLQPAPMAILPLAERVGSHMQVENTTARENIVAAIDR
jgi:hypothetical protein